VDLEFHLGWDFLESDGDRDVAVLVCPLELRVEPFERSLGREVSDTLVAFDELMAPDCLFGRLYGFIRTHFANFESKISFRKFPGEKQQGTK